MENTDSVVTIHVLQLNLISIPLKKLRQTKFHLRGGGVGFGGEYIIAMHLRTTRIR